MPFLWAALSILMNRWVLIPTIIALVAFGVYEKGRIDARHVAELAAKQAKIDTMERDVHIARQAEADANQKIDQLSAEAEQRDKEIADYAVELRSRPDRCDLTPADLDRLRVNPVSKSNKYKLAPGTCLHGPC